MDRGDMDRSFFSPGAAQEPSACGAVIQPAIRRGPLHRLGRSGFALASFCLLASCVDSYVAAQAPQTPPPPRPTNMARRQGVSPSGASVAVASFVGGPDGVRDRFTAAFEDAAEAQDIVMADSAAANYLVRGYLDAVPEGEDTAVTYVLDIFDANKHRTQRVEDQITVKAKAADPWSVVDDHVLAAVAAKSAAALAAVLTNTPEAILAAARANPANAGGETGRTIVAATPPVGPPDSAPPAGGLGPVALH